MSELTPQEKRYIELVALDRVYSSYDNVAQAIGRAKEVDSIRKEYSKKGGIQECIADEIFGTDDSGKFEQLSKIANDARIDKIIKRIDSIFDNQFSGNSKRKEGFKNFKAFYRHLFGDGFTPDKAKCYYCEITQEEITEIFNKKFIESKKFSPTMNIERLDSNKGYTPDNTALACPLCNNAKSDMIRYDNFQKYFKKSMREFIEDLLSGKITNNIKGQIDE